MSPKKQKLELTWIGKDERPRLEPRILREDPSLSYHAKQRVTENDIFDNMLIHGEDPNAISKAVDWQGGGGFRFFNLAPSLLEKDKWGNWVVSKQYNPAMLAEAVCKMAGFRSVDRGGAEADTRLGAYSYTPG